MHEKKKKKKLKRKNNIQNLKEKKYNRIYQNSIE